MDDEKIKQKFKCKYDDLIEKIKVEISHVVYDIDPKSTFWYYDLKEESMTIQQKYLCNYYHPHEYKDVLEKFFSHPNIKIHCNRQLDHDLWGEELIYSFIDEEFNKEIFCYMIVYDDMSPNAIDEEEECQRCQIQIEITYGQKLEDISINSRTFSI